MKFYKGQEDQPLLRLKEISSEWSRCTKCPLHEKRIISMPGVGLGGKDPDTDIMFVVDKFDGADIGASEFLSARSGQRDVLYNLLVDILDKDPDNYWVTVPTLCPTEKEDGSHYHGIELVSAPTVSCLNKCRPRLHQEIHAIQPELIVAFGVSALRALFPGKSPTHGKYLGEVVDTLIDGPNSPMSISVMVTHSLDALNRNRDYSENGIWKTTYLHLKRAFRIARDMARMRNGNPPLPEIAE